MELRYINFENLSIIQEELVAAIGQFDGLHLAHMYLINKIIKIAKEKKLKSAVFTFDPHPDFLINKLSKQKCTYVTPLSEKIEFLSITDLDYLIIIQFDENVMNMSPFEFVNQVLLANLVREVVVGFDFSFGKLGAGKAKDIKDLSNKLINTHIVEEKKYLGEKIGTSLIKTYLELGEMEKVKEVMGRYYKVKGKVVKGNQIGRTIHIPTANLNIDCAFAKVKKGVYAVIVTIDTKKYYGIANLGYNPSFNLREQLVFEIHIIDFNQDIYGKEIAVELVKYLREEKKFPSKEAFCEQITKDIKQAKNVFPKL